MHRVRFVGVATAVLVGLSTLVVPHTAQAADDLEFTGRVLAGHLGTVWLGPGLSENAAGCEPDSPFQGIDGDGLDLGHDLAWHRASLTFTSAGPANLDAYFYDRDCRYVGSGGLNRRGIGVAERGIVPRRAAFVFVDAAVGAEVSFTLRVDAASSEPAPLYEPRSEVARDRPLTIPMADGTRLHGHVYEPTGAGPFATILELSPYFDTGDFNEGTSEGQEVTEDDRRTLRGVRGAFLEAGFAVAVVNIRGTGRSEGCLQWGTDTELTDAATVVQYLSDAEWSRGQPVGMYGFSWSGKTQYWAMASRAPKLKAAVIASGAVDLWSVLTRNGAAVSHAPVLESSHNVYEGLGVNNPNPTPETVHAACPSYGEQQLRAAQLVTNGDRDPWWEQRDFRSRIAGTDVAVFASLGLDPLDDLLVGPSGGDMVTQLDGVWDALGPKKRFLIGQWTHSTPLSDRPDWLGQIVAWYDHHLRGGPERVASGVVEYQDDAGQWHTTGAWPPPAHETRLSLSGAGLSAKRATTASARSFQSGGTPCAGTCPATVRTDVCGPDQVLYVSPPLARDADMAGYFSVDLTLSSTLPDGNLAAYLYATPGDGVCPDGGVREVGRALTDLRHWEGTGYGRDFPVARPTPMRIMSEPFAARVPAGHRLVLAIGGESPELLPDPRKPLITVHSGPGLPGGVTLPVQGRPLRFAR